MSRDRVAIRPRGGSVEDRRSIVARAQRRGFHRFVLRRGEETGAADGDLIILEDSDGLHVPGSDARAIEIARVDSPEELSSLLARVVPGSTVALSWTADRVIPLENAVAARGRSFTLWALARSAREVPGALGALEHGADLVIVDVHGAAEVDRLETALDAPVAVRLEWVEVPLAAVTPAGPGDRIIVDTTSLLGPHEGMLVGSSAALLLHVASEAMGSRFSRPRPFRVNAGSAHSYLLMADGTTRYLSELGPGDAVLVSTPSGSARTARVGRIKIERRPLVQIAVSDGDTTRTLFAQEAESVRLSTSEGPVATTDLQVGSRLHAVRLPAARHLGDAVEETIEER